MDTSQFIMCDDLAADDIVAGDCATDFADTDGSDLPPPPVVTAAATLHEDEVAEAQRLVREASRH